MHDERSRRANGSVAAVCGGCYTILKEIGAGGSHLIYLAETEDSPVREVIIREFYPIQAKASRDEQGNLVFQEALLTECQEAFRREQDNAIAVGRVLTQAETEWAADETTFCSVMKPFSEDSKTLYKLLTDWQAAPPESNISRLYHSLNIISMLLSTLETLHTEGHLLHCDLSCYNVKVSGNQEDFITGNHLSAQIFDFGSVVQLDDEKRFHAESWEDLPASAPACRAQELERCSTDLTPATDLYAVSALLYGLVCGLQCSLFRWAKQDVSAHQKLVNNNFIWVRNDLNKLKISDTVRGNLLRILKKGMALEQGERYQTAHDMQKEIDRLANWIRPFQVDDLRKELYLHNRSLRDHNGIYHLGVQHEVSPGLFSRLCDPERGDAGSITSPDDAPPLYHYLTDGWNGTASFRHLILSGEGGSGKTTSLLETASRLQDEAVPVLYVPLNALTAKEHPLESYLRDVVFPNHEDGVGTLRACCRQERNVSAVPQIVFFLDGVNEINEEIRGAVIGEIQTWMGYDNLQVVVAGRNDISNYQAFFREGTPHLQLMPLEYGQVRQYLRKYKLMPAAFGAVSVLYNPLMLVLYVNTALYQKENPKLAGRFRPELTREAILWNYIEAQVLKSGTQNPQAQQRYAVRVAAHYAAAWVGWAMGDRYALNRAELTGLVDGFLQQQYARWKEIEELRDCGIRYWRPEPYQLVELLTDELCILGVEQERYSFRHQMFRDYYAAAAMAHEVQTQTPEESALWRPAPGYSWGAVCELLAGMLTEEQMEKLWASMRGVAVAPGSYAMHKLVAVLAARNGDDLSHIDFSEMDLRTVSLAGKRINTFSGKARFRNAKIGAATFTDGGVPQDVNKLSVSPDGKTLAAIGENRGCLMDLATGRMLAVFPTCNEAHLTRDPCWDLDSSYFSFVVQTFSDAVNGNEQYYYKTVDLAGNVDERIIRSEGHLISLRCGKERGSILGLHYNDDRTLICLQNYSLRIEHDAMDSSFPSYSWSKDQKYLFIAWKQNGTSESSTENRYRLIRFDLDMDCVTAQIEFLFHNEIRSVSSAPDGSGLLIEDEGCDYYLWDIQREEVTGIDCFSNPIWTADGKMLVYYDSHSQKLMLLQLSSRTEQKIQIDRLDFQNYLELEISSFMRDHKCYLIWYGYEGDGSGAGMPDKKSIVVETYDLTEHICLPVCRVPSAGVSHVHWERKGHDVFLFLYCENGDVFYIDARSKRCKHTNCFRKMNRLYAPDGTCFVEGTALANGDILYDVMDEYSGERRFSFQCCSDQCAPQWLDNSSGLLITQKDNREVELYRMNGEKRTLQIDGMGGLLEPVWSPSGTYVAQFSLPRGMIIRNLENRVIWEDDDRAGFRAVWSPDERYLLSVMPSELEGKQYDFVRRTVKRIQIPVPAKWCRRMVWAYRKNLIACIQGNELYLFYLKGQNVPETEVQSAEPFYQCESQISQVLFSLDEAYLAVSDEGGYLYLWNLDGIPQGGRPRVINNLPLYLKFRPVPGMNLVNADFTGAVFSDAETQELIRQNGGNVDGSCAFPDRACRLRNRNRNPSPKRNEK